MTRYAGRVKGVIRPRETLISASSVATWYDRLLGVNPDPGY